MIDARKFVALFARCLAALAAGVAQAQNYPTGPVRVIVPFPPGGGVDSAGRILASRLAENLGKSFVIDNRGGAGPHIKSGRLRALAVTSTVRLQAMPGLPTVVESGLRGYESSQWYGVLAPAGTPDDILNLLNAQVVKIMQTAEMKQRMYDDGVVPIGGSRQQFADHIKTEIAKWAKIIKQSGARID